MADSGITFESVKLLKPEPGEVVVMVVNDDAVSGEELAEATQRLAVLFPGNPVVVLRPEDSIETRDLDGAIEFLEGLRG